MLECRDIDALMMEFLYQELQQDQEGDFDAHVDSCARCQDEVAGFQHTRGAVSVLPDIEPPSSLTAILLHEAAKQAPSSRPAAVVALPDSDVEPGGILGWLSRLFAPIALHPAAAAIATLVLVAGVAGSFYIRGDHRVTTEVAQSERLAPAMLEAKLAEGMMRMPDNQRGNAAQPSLPGASNEAGYAVDLAAALDGESDEAQLSRDSNAFESTVPLSTEGRAESKKRQQLSASGGRLAGNKPTAKPRSVANAVSGADMLVDLEDSVGKRDQRWNRSKNKKPQELAVKPKPSRRGPASKRDQAEPPPPPRAPAPAPVVSRSTTSASKDGKKGRYRVYKAEDSKGKGAADSDGVEGEKADKSKSKKKAARDDRWAASRKLELDRAVKLKRCRTAAKIANDILDRTPDYYYQRVKGSSSMKTCSGFVAAERKRRSKSRGKRRAAKQAPKKSKKGGASSSGKAAPAPDQSTVSR